MPRDPRPPYQPARHGHGGYNVRGTRYPVGATRPTRTAAGMAFTGSRNGRITNDPAVLRLSVRGTLDALVGGIGRLTERSARTCPCCGARSTRLVLNPTGRARLATLRRRRTTA